MATFNSLESISPGTLVKADIWGGLVLSNLYVLRVGTYCKESPTKTTHMPTRTPIKHVFVSLFSHWAIKYIKLPGGYLRREWSITKPYPTTPEPSVSKRSKASLISLQQPFFASKIQGTHNQTWWPGSGEGWTFAAKRYNTKAEALTFRWICWIVLGSFTSFSRTPLLWLLKPYVKFMWREAKRDTHL